MHWESKIDAVKMPIMFWLRRCCKVLNNDPIYNHSNLGHMTSNTSQSLLKQVVRFADEQDCLHRTILIKRYSKNMWHGQRLLIKYEI